MFVHKGLFYCLACGYYGSGKMQQLTKPCKRLNAPNAMQRILLLKRGQLPRGLAAWPNDAVGSAASQQAALHLD